MLRSVEKKARRQLEARLPSTTFTSSVRSLALTTPTVTVFLKSPRGEPIASGFDTIGISPLGGSGQVALNLDQRQVCEWIQPHQRGRLRTAVRQNDLQPQSAFDDVVVRQDVTTGVYDDARSGGGDLLLNAE